MGSGNTTMHTALASAWSGPAVMCGDTLLRPVHKGNKILSQYGVLQISFPFKTLETISNKCFRIFDP
jgi:hypothetical protein